MSCVKCPVCGHGIHGENDCQGAVPGMLGWVRCGCNTLRLQLAQAQDLAADRLDQIRKLQDSANKRLDEYREVTALLRDALKRLEVEAFGRVGIHRDPCNCPTCELLKRAEVMNLR